MAKSTDEILAQIAAIRQRVAERYPSPRSSNSSTTDATDSAGSTTASEPPPLVDLMPLFHARDAAEGKVAAVGKVNPRHGGPVNSLIQAGKRVVARSLGWFVRDQVDFNSSAVRGFTETIEALNEANRSIATLWAEQNRLRREIRQISDDTRQISDETSSIRAEADDHLRAATDELSAQIRAVQQESCDRVESAQLAITRLEDVGEQQARETAAALEQLSAQATEQARARDREDVRLLRTLADVQKATQQQLSLVEGELRAAIERRGSLAEERGDASASRAVESALGRMEASVHRELRLLRQRVGAILERGGEGAEYAAAQAIAGESKTVSAGSMDSLASSERFRGTEDDVREKLRIYLPSFEGCSPVADLGCGRGEFLDLLRDTGGSGIGVESNAELAGIVRGKGHEAYTGDLFTFLRDRESESLGGIFCAHVIEHLPSSALARLIAEAHRVLRSGGLIALETPNPSCLAIFATYFYLDPTHVRPVPSELVSYLLEEAGFVQISVNGLHPAGDEFPELKPLPDAFRQRFFGHLDYGVVAHKP